MKRLIESIVVVVCGTAMIFGIVGCATDNGNYAGGDNHDHQSHQQEEDESGTLSDDQVAGFEREIESQYDQLQMTYVEYDQALTTLENEPASSKDSHKLHRKLMRRHITLARLHEDRVWLYADGGGESVDDRGMAEIHRAAANWHEERFQEDGQGVEEQDAELKSLRKQINGHHPLEESVRGDKPSS